MKTIAEHNSSAQLAGTTPDVARIWEGLARVADPELPVLSVVELGLVQSVEWRALDECTITITPSYSGCPAMTVIEDRIREELRRHGIANVNFSVRLSPPWTTDWLSPEAREKLRRAGVTPPQRTNGQPSAEDFPILRDARPLAIPCPRCGSSNTALVSQFGPTLCTALYRCMECLEPFEFFKDH